MPLNIIFDTKYHEQYGAANGNQFRRKYRIAIGHTTPDTYLIPNRGEMSLVHPGMKLTWAGDQSRFMSAFMGSTLEMTALLDDDQLETLEALMNLNEGDVFALFFDSWNANDTPYWYGHLLVEETTIRIAERQHLVDLTFTDGIASLQGRPWRQDNGSPYTGFHPLTYYMREIIKKLPARSAFEQYCDANTPSSHVPTVSEIGFPDPRPDGEASQEFHSGDSKLYYIKVRAETFTKPKKQVDRHRNLAPILDFFDTYSVLEDICKTFGATACMFNGYINLMCRLDVSTMRGQGVAWSRHMFRTSDGDLNTFRNVGGDGELTSDDDWYIADGDARYEVRNGAVKRRTLPIYQVNMTHEEGGSDWLYANGYFLDTTISHIDHSEAMSYASVSAAAQQAGGYANMSNIMQVQYSQYFEAVDGNRRDLWYAFLHRGGSGAPDDPYGTYNNGNSYQSFDLGFYKFPSDITDYTGFPAYTINDLEFQSGEQMKFDFSNVVRFTREKAFTYSFESQFFREFHVGKTLIARYRIQFTTTGGTVYRLRRHITTHINSNGSPDGINIKGNGLGFIHSGDTLEFGNDRTYFRKVYESLDWVKTGDSDFADAWFEVLVPDGEYAKSGDGWGTDTFENYDAQYGLHQPDFAPIGCKLDNNDGEEGEGVQYEKAEESTFVQYFGGQESVELPLGDNEEVLDFESFYFEMGFSYWKHNEGPRPNNGASYNPIWRTAYADGTGGYRKHTGSGSWRTLPEFIHVEAARVQIGDGSESADFVTKIKGGDGYELANLGSSRLGSRLSFINTHVGGTLWARRKDSADIGDFDFSGSGDHSERLQWRGHSAGDVAYSGIPQTVYDSLHSYVCNAFIDLFGESRVVYDMTLIQRQDSDESSLIHPFHVMAFKKLVGDKSITEYLMPLSYTWTMNEGIEASYLKVAQTREKSGLVDFTFPVNGMGTKNPGGKFAPGKNIGSRISRNGRKLHNISVQSYIDLDAEKGKISTNQTEIVNVKQIQEEEEMNKLLATRPTTGLTSKANPSVSTQVHNPPRAGD